MKTVGSPLNNLNNHPVVSGRFALVHNGSVNSLASWHQGIKDSLPFHHYAEVDSQLLVETIDILVEERNWKIGNAISRGIPHYITGSYACVAVDSADPNTLHLFRGSNPLVLGYDKATGVIWFASTQEIIDAALGTTTRHLDGLFVERHPPKKGSLLYSELTSDEYLQITCKNGTIKWEGGSLDRSYTPASIPPPVSSHNGATATRPELSSGSSCSSPATGKVNQHANDPSNKPFPARYSATGATPAASSPSSSKGYYDENTGLYRSSIFED